MTHLPTCYLEWCQNEHIHGLYRCYASDGQLVYVGQTGDIYARFEVHRYQSPFWGKVARVTVEWVDEVDAKDRERQAIRTERPLLNRHHHPDYAGLTTSQRYDLYLWREAALPVARPIWDPQIVAAIEGAPASYLESVA